MSQRRYDLILFIIAILLGVVVPATLTAIAAQRIQDAFSASSVDAGR